MPLIHSLTVLSYPDRPAKLPLWLAQDAGLFEKYGLKVDIKTPKSGEDIVEGIGRDEAQIYAATANWIVSGIGDGKDLVFFANTGYSVLKLLSQPSITRPSELKGKRVGTGEANSSQDRITRQALQRLGLDPDKDVTFVPMGQRSITRLNALVKGEIDATTSNEDNIFDLERRGEIDKVRVLADNESLKLFIGGGVDFAVTRNLLVNSRPVGQRIRSSAERSDCPGAARTRPGRSHLHALSERQRSRACWNSCTEPMFTARFPSDRFPDWKTSRSASKNSAPSRDSRGNGRKTSPIRAWSKSLKARASSRRLYRQRAEHGKYGE